MESPPPTAATSPAIRSSINTLTPWFSAITSILVIGLPHAYYGAWRRAIGFLAAGAALSALAIAALGRFPLSLTICLGLVTWSFYVWVAIDAVRLSRSAARAARPSSASRWLGAAGFLIVSLITSGLISAPLRRAGLDGKRLAWARVVAVGSNVRSVELDDRVLFDPEDRAEVELHGDDYVLLRERDIHAVASERLTDGGTGLYL